ncbi:hypothetical protein LB503_005566 [Fusarium chuoi]|nr:hypothetical protein LB503_005566 [Fusarium chuoi]
MGSVLSTESEFDEEVGESSQMFDTKVVEGLTLLVSTKDTSGAPMTPMDTNTTQPDITTFDYSPLPIPTALQSTISHQPEPASRSLDSTPSPIPELPKNWSYLLDLYFETTHCWFPVSQKHELLRAAYTLSNGPSTTSACSLSSGETAIYSRQVCSRTQVALILDMFELCLSYAFLKWIRNVGLQHGLRSTGPYTHRYPLDFFHKTQWLIRQAGMV